jgi:mRNA interferase RelE/StbE
VYRVEFTRPASRQLRSLPKGIAIRIGERIRALAVDPRPRGALKLTGAQANLYRIRVGDYRVVYQVRDDVLIVVILRVGKRDEASYRGL